MASWTWKAGLASLAIVAASAFATAQMSDHPGMQGQMGRPDQPSMSPPSGMPAQMHSHMMQMQGRMHGGAGQHDMMGMHGGMTGQPTLPGQDAFGAIQEVVQILEADPATDWSKVNIDTLREHLIDMNEVTLRAAAAERILDNGIEIADRRGAHVCGHQTNGSCARRRTRQARLERQDGGPAERSEAHRRHQRPQGTDQAQGARLHGDHGAGCTPPAAPSDDG